MLFLGKKKTLRRCSVAAEDKQVYEPTYTIHNVIMSLVKKKLYFFLLHKMMTTTKLAHL